MYNYTQEKAFIKRRNTDIHNYYKRNYFSHKIGNAKNLLGFLLIFVLKVFIKRFYQRFLFKVSITSFIDNFINIFIKMGIELFIKVCYYKFY